MINLIEEKGKVQDSEGSGLNFFPITMLVLACRDSKKKRN